jgi:hypothetical protein
MVKIVAIHEKGVAVMSWLGFPSLDVSPVIGNPGFLTLSQEIATITSGFLAGIAPLRLNSKVNSIG